MPSCDLEPLTKMRTHTYCVTSISELNTCFRRLVEAVFVGRIVLSSPNRLLICFDAVYCHSGSAAVCLVVLANLTPLTRGRAPRPVTGQKNENTTPTAQAPPSLYFLVTSPLPSKSTSLRAARQVRCCQDSAVAYGRGVRVCQVRDGRGGGGAQPRNAGP